MLLKVGYPHFDLSYQHVMCFFRVDYVSFEHEIENRKTEYYRVLRSCQAHRPNEAAT